MDSARIEPTVGASVFDPKCLFCHCNAVEPVADTLNRYRPPLFRGHAIGCERCHGPGELHVGDGSGETIVKSGTPIR